MPKSKKLKHGGSGSLVLHIIISKSLEGTYNSALTIINTIL